MTEHKTTLTERTKNLMKANDSTKALDQQLKAVEAEFAQVSKESKAMDAMLLNIVTAMQPAMKAELAEKNNLNMPAFNLPELPLSFLASRESTSSTA